MCCRRATASRSTSSRSTRRGPSTRHRLRAVLCPGGQLADPHGQPDDRRHRRDGLQTVRNKPAVHRSCRSRLLRAGHLQLLGHQQWPRQPATIDALLAKSAEELIEGVTSIGSPLIDYLLDSFFSVVFADCDGWVAVDQHSFTGRDLHLATASGPSTKTQTYPGYNSPDGCGANSLYEVT